MLALDLGTSSVRSAVFDKKARALPDSRASAEYHVRHTADHGAELDPARVLRATRKCLRLTNSTLTTVAASGFWHSLLGVDRSGTPLTPIYTWADARCAPEAARLRGEFDERKIHQRTGCMLRASFWPAKLLWLRRTDRALFRRVARWVSPADWIAEQIFGLRACSHSMASGTGLYDSMRRTWDGELLERCGIREGQLNPLRDRVDDSFPAIGDGAASNLGSGATAPGVVAINVGTSAAVRAIVPGAAPLSFGLFRFVVDAQRTLLGGAVSNAGNLRAWCLRELRLTPNDRAIERLLRAAGPRAGHLTILPFWVNERAPTWPENLEGAILGLTQTTTAADLLHATTAAVCHRLAQIFDELRTALGGVRQVVVSGGILQSPASLQILADSLGSELVTCLDQEASLRGAAVHALEQIGRKIPPPRYARRIRPRPENVAPAREQRQRQETLEKVILDAAATLSLAPAPGERKAPAISKRT